MHIRIALLLSLIAAVAGAAVLGPEVPVAQPLLAEANGDQRNAVLASAGGDSLAAWFDYDRNGLYVTTIAADGAVSAPARRIYSGPASGISLCWTGTTYLVTWYDYVAGLLAMPLGRDGAPNGAARLIAPAQTLTDTGALAWNGRHAFLAYYTDQGHSAAALLDEQANVIRADIALPDNLNHRFLAAAAGSTFHLFVRTSQFVQVSPGINKTEETITVQRFAGDGTPIDASGTLVSRTDVLANSWGVASDGNRLALVVVEGFSQPALRRFLIDPQTLASQSLPAINVIAPSGVTVTWNGSSFIAVWSDYGHGSTFSMMTLPFSDGSAVQPDTVFTQDGSATDAIATYNGRNVVTAWLDRSIGSDLAGVLLDPTATRTAGEHFTISTSNQWQVSSALARSLAVWIETEGDNAYDVFAARARVTGFGPRVRVSTSTRAYGPLALVYTGDTYLVVWQEFSSNSAIPRIMSRRLRPDGTLLDDQPIVVTDAGSDPSVAFNGSTVLLAYSFGAPSFGFTTSGTPSFVAGIRFDRLGNRIDAAPFTIPASFSVSGNAHGTSVATNGADFLIVWRYDPTPFCCSDPPGPPAPPPPPAPTPEIRAVRVTATGTLLDAEALKIASSVSSLSSPAVAWSGADYLVAFGTRTDTARIVAQRLLRDGTTSGAPIVLAEHAGESPFPIAILGDTAGCWISWSDTDVHLAHVSTGGLDAAPAAIATAAVRPAFGPGSIAYTLTDPDRRLVVTRALPALTHRRATEH